MPRVGAPIPLALQLFDGATNKYARASLYNAAGTELAGSPFALTHAQLGIYKNSSVLMPNSAHVTAQYVVYDDAGFTTESATHSRALDVFYLDEIASTLLSDEILGLVESSDIVGLVEDF